jgi:hypothetical protein
MQNDLTVPLRGIAQVARLPGPPASTLIHRRGFALLLGGESCWLTLGPTVSLGFAGAF